MKGFKKGAEVRMTALGFIHGLPCTRSWKRKKSDLSPILGAITKDQKENSELTSVRLAGRKASERYHEKFWEEV